MRLKSEPQENFKLPPAMNFSLHLCHKSPKSNSCKCFYLFKILPFRCAKESIYLGRLRRGGGRGMKRDFHFQEGFFSFLKNPLCRPPFARVSWLLGYNTLYGPTAHHMVPLPCLAPPKTHLDLSRLPSSFCGRVKKYVGFGKNSNPACHRPAL